MVLNKSYRRKVDGWMMDGGWMEDLNDGGWRVGGLDGFKAGDGWMLRLVDEVR